MSDLLQLEDLPKEIFVEICQYLSVHDLYFSLSHLNGRLNSIFQSLPNLNCIITSHSDPVLSFFKPFKTVQLQFDCSQLSTLSQFDLSNFIGIQSFSIYSPMGSYNNIEPVEQLEKFLHPDLCPHLRSLQIPYCSKRLANWISTGAFPHLEVCHLDDDRYRTVALPSSANNRLPTLRQLTLRNRNCDELEKIFLLCPNLNYLDFSFDSILPSLASLNSPYSSLKHLRLYRIKFFVFHHNDQFDSFLSYFPNLIHFYLTVDQCPVHNERLDFHQIAQYFHHRVSRLKVLQMRIYVTDRNRSSLLRYNFKEISQLHPLFKCFGRSGNLMHIASFDFTATCYYDHRFVRRSFQSL